MLVGIIIVIILVIVIAWFATLLNRDIVDIMGIMRKGKEGDLTGTMIVESNTELGIMAYDVMDTFDRISELIKKTQEATAKVTDESGNLSVAVGETSASIEEVSKALSEIAAGAEAVLFVIPPELKAVEGSEPVVPDGKNVVAIEQLLDLGSVFHFYLFHFPVIPDADYLSERDFRFPYYQGNSRPRSNDLVMEQVKKGFYLFSRPSRASVTERRGLKGVFFNFRQIFVVWSRFTGLCRITCLRSG